VHLARRGNFRLIQSLTNAKTRAHGPGAVQRDTLRAGTSTTFHDTRPTAMPPPPLDPAFEAQVQQVHAITSKPLNHIRSDLRFTKSVEATINRVLDGTFLQGTERDPARGYA
jgi:hypothetical protein